MRFRNPLRVAPLLPVLFPLLVTAVPASTQTVYAAASLATALREITQLLPGQQARLSFASSSSLAKQIAAGAPADLYFSANAQWMDYLENRRLIVTDTRTDLLTNRLVVIAPSHHAFEVRSDSSFDFVNAFEGRLAVGDPSHVPVGMYARQALDALGWFSGLADRLAPAPHARGALVYVERGECTAGVVYATDAAISNRVQILATFPASAHQPIVYPLAAIATGDDDPRVARLLSHYRSREAAAVFRRHGFLPLEQQRQSAQ